MPILTFVARISDGLLLVASMEHAGDYTESLDIYKQQGKQIMKKLSPRSPAKCSIESGPYNFYYLIEEGICYLTLSDKSYPKRLSFLYLEEIHAGFIQELQRDFGEGWRKCVGTVARPYAFIKFDKFIQRKRKDYTDPSSRQNMSKLNDDLVDIHNVMRKNIQEVLNRGERIEHVSRTSAEIAAQSKDFKWGAKKLSIQALWKKHGPLVVISFFVIGLLYLKFFW